MENSYGSPGAEGVAVREGSIGDGQPFCLGAFGNFFTLCNKGEEFFLW